LRCFKTPSELTLHLRIHSRDKPFKCEHFPKAFSNSSNLTKHLLTHSGEKNIQM